MYLAATATVVVVAFAPASLPRIRTGRGQCSRRFAKGCVVRDQHKSESLREKREREGETGGGEHERVPIRSEMNL